MNIELIQKMINEKRYDELYSALDEILARELGSYQDELECEHYLRILDVVRINEKLLQAALKLIEMGEYLEALDYLVRVLRNPKSLKPHEENARALMKFCQIQLDKTKAVTTTDEKRPEQ